ncbi:trimethylamine methyltransferase family protein [Rhodovulum adriaticum]|uniref:Trimethylamine:corrinoid methyltransferase n=1 Tax=Rhodovulum adriaticum TaxID=35804 RepID=A0A4R2NTN4_RHOAD|nr:trimethylamine methyltransferase family protein [Rhodovulum adriaticum]MBK1635056.1 hypothetical protein [Rhodovulum adriaticum]TCP25310.1 trimethylamine:corrinoid methyltransferase [Rhodovulum adriaticum]
MRRRPRKRFVTPPAADAFRLDTPAQAADAVAVLRGRALDLLAGHGVVIRHPALQAALRRAGARPARDADRLRLPRPLVEEALAATPKTVALAGKIPARDIALPRADGGFVMRTGTGAHRYIAPDGTSRPMDLRAVTEIAAVAETLSQVGFIAHPFVHGVPEKTADIHGYAALMARTTKHVWMQPYQRRNIGYLMCIAAVAAGGEDALRARPLTSAITCAFSPLEFKRMDSEVIVEAGRFGVPLHACSLPSGGGTAPFSEGGTALIAVAEILAMVTIAHHLAPGTPVIATPLIFTLDMATGAAQMACVESIQAAALAVRVLKQGFGLITHSYGMGCDTPRPGAQSMAERSLLGQAVSAAGADILGGVGQLQTATAFSPVQAVLDDQIGAMLRRLRRPPPVDDDSLNWTGLTAIRTGGHFLADPHTLARCRHGLQPGAFLRPGRQSHDANDGFTALDTAREAALAAIAAAPQDGVLSTDQRAEIAALVAHADRHVPDAFAETGPGV